MAPAVKNKIACVFPGIGVRLSGPELRFFERNRSVFDPFFREASAYADIDLIGEFLGGTISRLDDRRNQFFTYAFSAGAYAAFQDAGVVPDFLGGYSFGVYSALFAAGAVSFIEGLLIFEKALALMETTSRDLNAGMGVVIGLRRREVESMLAEERFRNLCIANVNNDTCVIVSGPCDALTPFLDEALKQDAIAAQPLDVSIPYHHPELLAGVTPRFRQFLGELSWKEPAFPIISSIDQSILDRTDQLVDFAANNLSTPISWHSVVARLHSLGVHRIVECGPGISLTQNGRFMSFDVRYISVKNSKRTLGV